MFKPTKYIALTAAGAAVVALTFAIITSAQAQMTPAASLEKAATKAVSHVKKDRHLMMNGVVKLGVAVIVPTKGNDVHGTVYFKQDGTKVHVTGKITGLKPNSQHGFHIHQYGDLTSSDGSSLGGHYNPENNQHALPHHRPRHAGDLGDITANSQGIAKVDITVDNISVSGKLNPILGRGVVAHAKKDNGSQPSGAAGARIGVGVIGIAQVKK